MTMLLITDSIPTPFSMSLWFTSMRLIWSIVTPLPLGHCSPGPRCPQTRYHQSTSEDMTREVESYHQQH